MKLSATGESQPHYIYAVILITGLFYLAGCGVSDEGSGDSDIETEQQWLIPEQEVVDGGPGRDGIPSIDNPTFESASQIGWIGSNRRITALNVDGEIRAYPHQILDWHEIVNDRFGGRDVAVTYCPLTATGICWFSDGEFGTSGLLFRNNLIAYDRKTGSLWSQMRMRAVNGPRMGDNAREINRVIETTWSTWKKLYPESDVLTTTDQIERDSTVYAYGEDYATVDDLILFPPKYRNDKRLNNKDRVHAIIASDSPVEDSPVKVYQISKFGEGISLVHDTFEGEEYVIVGSESLDLAAAFKTTLPDGTQLEFTALQNELPAVMTDQEGNKWDLFGTAVEGPRLGQRLRAATSYNGFWFAVRDLYRLPDIYEFE